MSSPTLLRSLRPFTQCSRSTHLVSLDVARPRGALSFVRAKSSKAAKVQAAKNSSAASRAPSTKAQASTTSTNTAKAEVAAESTPGAQALRSGTGKVTEAEQDSLPWADYLSIRKKKRRWETAMTIPFTLGGFVGGIMYFGNLDVDPAKPIFLIEARDREFYQHIVKNRVDPTAQSATNPVPDFYGAVQEEAYFSEDA
ncbi:uncharacterized protein B0H18DRAFT_1001336 [Fomitopsis serialis]|uniref:uncharacterized protein n=1 Tax=Fomitopsis serialis TaxID=139415 RepID=UPI002007F953|nr:uncharacterized protein B0H18DRAFT_1001336 [Neoantrodia serialis]KAH9928086.1 hypothetical protein B0H18DRAFT_1001336 [Neoantrodia serialis]